MIYVMAGSFPAIHVFGNPSLAINLAINRTWMAGIKLAMTELNERIFLTGSDIE